jgi:hypothetical protein
MNYLEILKKFDKAIITESQKLQEIYEELCNGDNCDSEETTETPEETPETPETPETKNQNTPEVASTEEPKKPEDEDDEAVALQESIKNISAFVKANKRLFVD